MERLMRLGMLAISGVAAARARQAAREGAAHAAAVLVAVVLGSGALGCTTAALWLAVAPTMGRTGAWLVAAGVLAGVSIAVLLGQSIWRAACNRRATGSWDSANAMAAFDGLEWPLVGVALLAGFMSARGRSR